MAKRNIDKEFKLNAVDLVQKQGLKLTPGSYDLGYRKVDITTLGTSV